MSTADIIVVDIVCCSALREGTSRSSIKAAHECHLTVQYQIKAVDLAGAYAQFSSQFLLKLASGTRNQ